MRLIIFIILLLPINLFSQVDWGDDEDYVEDTVEINDKGTKFGYKIKDYENSSEPTSDEAIQEQHRAAMRKKRQEKLRKLAEEVPK